MVFNFLKYVRLLAIVALAGCATQVTLSSDPQTAKPYFAPSQTTEQGTARKAGKLNLVLSEAARAKLADNLKFNQGTLHETVRRALAANNLLADNPDSSLPNINITVTDVRVRSSFSAVMFGFMAGSDRIVGDVVVSEPTGKELQRFNVSVSYALGGLAGGQNSTRMEWLYENFAKETANTLLGVKKDKESG